MLQFHRGGSLAHKALDTLLRLPSLIGYSGVYLYRILLSPNKGYRCAHGVLHGQSCSDVALDAFRTQPVHTAIATCSGQFEACRESYGQALATPHAFGLDTVLVDAGQMLIDSLGFEIAACGEKPQPPTAPP